MALPITKSDLTRILQRLRQARHLLDAGREIAAKADNKPLATLLSERVAAIDGDIRRVDSLRECEGARAFAS